MRPLYNLKQNIFLWASPNCGSSTIRDILCQSRGYDFDILGRNLQGYPQKKEIYDWIILNPLLYNQDNNINIAFIRNPYDRFISGVFQKHIEGDLDGPI
jgi:hypothetical protein